jgi:hypothetical protein
LLRGDDLLWNCCRRRFLRRRRGDWCGWWSRDNERLVTVEHQKGEKNGDENATLHRHYRGTGSTPWRPKG